MEERHDVVLVTEQGPVSRHVHPSREEAERWAEENAHYFDGHLVVVPHGERVECHE